MEKSLLIISSPHNRTPPPDYGGTERVAHTQALAGGRAGLTVRMMAKRGSRDYGGGLWTAFQWPTRFGAHLSFVLMSLKVLVAGRGTVAIINNYMPRWVFLVRPLLKAPVYQWLHNEFFMDGLTRRFIRPGDRLVFLSRYSMNRAVASGVPSHCSTYVYNAVDTDFFTPTDAPREDWLLFVGRLCADKGVDTAIRVARLAGRKLILAGTIGVSDRAYFESAVKPFLAEGVCEFIGPVTDGPKRDLMRRAAAVIMPSRFQEQCPLVAIEANACGAPVIGSNSGALPEIVESGVTGYIDDTDEGLAAACGRLASYPAATCRERAVRLFGIDAHSRAIMALIDAGAAANATR